MNADNLASVNYTKYPNDLVLTKQFHRGASHNLHKIKLFNNLNFVLMKNLAELGVQELNAAEMKNTDGGFIPILLAGLVLYGSIAPYYTNWDVYKK